MFCCVSKGKKRVCPKGPQRVKVTVIGDAECGKTSLIQRFCTGTFPDHYTPTLFDCTSANLNTGEKQVQLTIQDTAGQEELDRLRPPFYLHTDVVVVCFAVDNPSSLCNVQKHWMPEARRYCGRDVPVVLVATKADKGGQESCLNTSWQDPSVNTCGRKCSSKDGVLLPVARPSDVRDAAQERLLGLSAILVSTLGGEEDCTSSSSNCPTSSLPASSNNVCLGESTRLQTKADLPTTLAPNVMACETSSGLRTKDIIPSIKCPYSSYLRRNSRIQSTSTRCLVVQDSGDSEQDWESVITKRPNSAEVLTSIQTWLIAEGQRVSKALGAHAFCVSSSARNVGMERVFRAAVDAAVSSKQWKQKHG